MSAPWLAARGADAARLAAGEHSDPHAVLGAHPATREQAGGARESGLVVRAYHPDATGADLLLEQGGALPMEALGDGLFAAFVPGAAFPLRYRLRFRFANGDAWEREDPYRFPPTVGELDLHLFGEGTHRRLWRVLGAHPMTIDGVAGTRFAVWAPNARRVSVIGHFNRWDGRVYPMRSLGASGVWELFVPGVGAGDLYKYELLTREGQPRVKTDPFARMLEQPPGNASIVVPDDRYAWGDDDWMRRRAARPAEELGHEPVAIYE
ncbi:MAG TPA: 1,4-alpha-glucan branching enzyme, partial [Gemmatimonadaceae bacterium]